MRISPCSVSLASCSCCSCLLLLIGVCLLLVVSVRLRCLFHVPAREIDDDGRPFVGAAVHPLKSLDFFLGRSRKACFLYEVRTNGNRGQNLDSTVVPCLGCEGLPLIYPWVARFLHGRGVGAKPQASWGNLFCFVLLFPHTGMYVLWLAFAVYYWSIIYLVSERSASPAALCCGAIF